MHETNRLHLLAFHYIDNNLLRTSTRTVSGDDKRDLLAFAAQRDEPGRPEMRILYVEGGVLRELVACLSVADRVRLLDRATTAMERLVA